MPSSPLGVYKPLVSQYAANCLTVHGYRYGARWEGVACVIIMCMLLLPISVLCYFFFVVMH
jgi:hypothetical protein